MKTRREFIKTATVAGIGMAVTGIHKSSATILPTKINKPIVVSTWRFGIEANAAAWEVLKQNGRALDAVEAVHLTVDAVARHQHGFGNHDVVGARALQTHGVPGVLDPARRHRHEARREQRVALLHCT